MQISDLEDVIALDQLSFNLPWPKSAFKYELNENPLSRLWVATNQHPNESTRIVGVIVIWLILDEMHIATIAVHPDYRQQGIAKKLLAVAIENAIQRGMVQATLEVRASNLAAQSLYKRFGFNIVGQRHHYYQDNGEDAIIMTANPLDKDYLEWIMAGNWKEPQGTVSN